MSRIHTSVVTDAHEYTRADSPWILDEYKSIYGKLIHYLSGGGMNTFGRTLKQERVRRRQIRFLVWSGVLAVVWALFYFV